jgi:hypothetical protein
MLIFELIFRFHFRIRIIKHIKETTDNMLDLRAIKFLTNPNDKPRYFVQRYLGYGISRGGSDWTEYYVMEV